MPRIADAVEPVETTGTPISSMAQLLNSNLVRQGARGRANMMPPTSIMDERYPAWKRNQEDAEKLMLATDLIGSAIPLAGPAAKGMVKLAQYAKPQVGQALENYAFQTGMALPMVERQAGRTFTAPQDEALRLAQERAALPVERGGLGLPPNNTAEQRAAAMGTNTNAYHASKQNITNAFSPGYDDNLAFVTANPDFANNWLGKGKFQKRLGETAEAEVKAAEQEFRDLKYKTMDYDSLNQLQGDAFHKEYDIRNEKFKQLLQKKMGIYPDKIHNTVYPVKVQANKTFNPETDMDVMAEFFKVNDIPQKVQDLYSGGNYLMYETKPVVDYLKSRGYDSMRLRESTGDNYPTIAVFNPETIRSRFAAFDPFRRNAAIAAAMGVAAPDLLAQERTKIKDLAKTK